MKQVKVTDSGTMEPLVTHEMAEPEHIPAENSVDEELWAIFPPEAIEAFEGLAYLGSIEREYDFAGHVFVIRTLTEGEIIRAKQLAAAYTDTDSHNEATVLYIVSAALVKVDGRDFPSPLSPDYDVIYERAQKVRRWYPAVIAWLYERYIELENTASSTLAALKK